MNFKDDEGRIIAVEIKLYGEKTLIVNLYAPNGSKEKFFTDLRQKLQEQIILTGDFNGVIDLNKD